MYEQIFNVLYSTIWFLYYISLHYIFYFIFHAINASSKMFFLAEGWWSLSAQHTSGFLCMKPGFASCLWSVGLGFLYQHHTGDLASDWLRLSFPAASQQMNKSSSLKYSSIPLWQPNSRQHMQQGHKYLSCLLSCLPSIAQVKYV